MRAGPASRSFPRTSAAFSQPTRCSLTIVVKGQLQFALQGPGPNEYPQDKLKEAKESTPP